MARKSRSLWAVIVVAMLSLTSCGSWKNVAYFQDRDSINEMTSQKPTMVTLAPGDKIGIFVQTEDAETSNLFNLAYTPRMLGTANSYAGTTQGALGYTIDGEGNVDFPTVGKIHVAGKTRSQVAELVKNELNQKGQAKDAVVTVEFLDLTIAVLGEVKNPGRYNISKDIISVIDAIGMAGDLTIDGERKNVLVMREENGKQMMYNLDLTQGKQLLNSPAFYLQQNDMVYVQPSNKKARTATVNGNNIFSASFWLSVASTTVTVLTFIYAYASKK